MNWLGRDKNLKPEKKSQRKKKDMFYKRKDERERRRRIKGEGGREEGETEKV